MEGTPVRPAPLPRSEAQRQASRLNGAHSSGPTSSAGKTRASRNATTHGLFARALLLPGESEIEYQATLEHWLTTLAPSSPALVDLVHRVADTFFRQERLHRQENEILGSEVAAKTALTLPGTRLAAARDALGAVQGLALLAEGVMSIMPAAEVQKLSPAMARVTEAAMASDISFALVRALGASVEAVVADTILEVVPESFRALARACRAVEHALVARITELEVEVVRERERIGRELYFRDLPEIRRLGPVRARLAREMDVALEVFRKTKELASQAPASLSSQPCQVELHVIGRP